MDNVINLRRDPHHESQLLLPWFVSGALDADDQRLVADHMADCAECRAALAEERRLRAEIAALAPAGTPVAPSGRPNLPERRLRTIAPWLGWAAAASLALALAVRPAQLPAPTVYHALAAASSAPSANLAVIFAPDTPEAGIRRLLAASHARVVDGPTPADAWLLAAPAGERDAALAKLRTATSVRFAEPIDPAGP